MSARFEMAYFYPQGHAAHAVPHHPEAPERVEIIQQALAQAGWLDQFTHLVACELPRPLLETVHHKAYLDLLEMACRRAGGWRCRRREAPWRWRRQSGRAGRGAALRSPARPVTMRAPGKAWASAC